MNILDKDSVGNELPKSVFLGFDASLNETDRALSVNSFRLSAAFALEKGYTVIYENSRKEATIIDKEGFISYIAHL